MSIFAGIYSPRELCLKTEQKKERDDILKHISRTGGDPLIYDRPGFFLATIFSDSTRGMRISKGVCFVNGRSYYNSTKDKYVAPSTELECAIDMCRAGDASSYLTGSRGAFSLCYYNENEHVLTLGTDRYGSKPIYIAKSGECYFFASAIRILEKISGLNLKFNIAKACEKLLMGYHLGDHTPYDNVTLLRGGECSQIAKDKWTRLRYHKWGQGGPNRDDPKNWETNSYDIFKEAVAIRAADAEKPLAMLSGGLDSRCIATVLSEVSAGLNTVTFESKGRKDDKIALAYAKALGVSNHLIHKPYTQPNVEALHELSRLMQSGENPSISTQRIFSGDGGSVGVGFCYVNQELVDLVAKGDLAGLARSIFSDRLPKRLFRKSDYDDIKQHLLKSLDDEIRDIDVDDPYRFVHFFFLNTDQRCHLHWFHEDIDLFKMEFETPFMDSLFCEYLYSIPGEHFMYHKFYHKWVECFPAVFKSVPWQTYPKHLPCPIAFDESLPDQWTRTRNDRFKRGDGPLTELELNLLSRNFPPKSFNRLFILQAALLHRFRIRHFGNIFEIVNGIMKYRGSSSSIGLK
jgi:asparagine synthase (glutamine-hydrolysing)